MDFGKDEGLVLEGKEVCSAEMLRAWTTVFNSPGNDP